MSAFTALSTFNQDNNFTFNYKPFGSATDGNLPQSQVAIAARRKLNLDHLDSRQPSSSAGPSKKPKRSYRPATASVDEASTSNDYASGSSRMFDSFGYDGAAISVLDNDSDVDSLLRERRGSAVTDRTSDDSLSRSPAHFPHADFSPTTPSHHRAENSLSTLTQRFMQLLQGAPEQTLNLNDACKQLNVAKRRVYDITNVLEGIDLVEKVQKNGVRLLPQHDPKLNFQLSMLVTDNECLEKEEARLDRAIAEMQAAFDEVTCADDNKRYAYNRYEDLRNEVPQYRTQTVIAIKAPMDTQLEVPEPGDSGDWQIHMKSNGGPIQVFLCPTDDQTATISTLNDTLPFATADDYWQPEASATALINESHPLDVLNFEPKFDPDSFNTSLAGSIHEAARLLSPMNQNDSGILCNAKLGIPAPGTSSAGSGLRTPGNLLTPRLTPGGFLGTLPFVSLHPPSSDELGQDSGTVADFMLSLTESEGLLDLFDSDDTSSNGAIVGY